jgi:predicted RNase H-like HicB family nuclease
MIMRQVVLYPDVEDGGWVAEVPSLPGCVSDGDTKEDALRNVRDAIESWISVAEENGTEVPPETLDVMVCVVP